MNGTHIIYEFPLKERIRLFLRLEHLFEISESHSEKDSALDSRSAIFSLIETLEITERVDIKTELQKELDRLLQRFNELQQTPSVDREKLDLVMDNLDHCQKTLHEIHGKVDQGLQKSNFIKTIRQRISLPGSTCSFDLPELHLWLQQEPTKRCTQLSSWNETFRPTKYIVQAILGLIRDSASPYSEDCKGSGFSKALDHYPHIQLVRAAIPKRYNVYPTFSGNKHRLNIRFSASDVDPKALEESKVLNFEFLLWCCGV